MGHFYLCYRPWLELCNIFQTYEGLDDVKDVQAEVRAVRELLDEEASGDEEATC